MYLIMYMMYIKNICVYIIYVIVIHTYSYKIEFNYYLLLCASHISPSYLDVNDAILDRWICFDSGSDIISVSAFDGSALLL